MIAARRTSTGWIIGQWYERERDGRPGYELRHPRHVRTAAEAAEAFVSALATPKKATEPKSVTLDADDLEVVRLLRERGSLTPGEYLELRGCRRLAARICDIRKVYGAHMVKTERVRHGASSYARYRWVEQRELGL